MPLGYDGKLYILAFDHRGSFQKKWFGLGDEITQEDTDRITDAKTLIYEGLELALGQGAEPRLTGALVDEQFGGEVPARAKAHGIKLAMPVEKSGQNEFDFQYGDDFGAHIETFDPDFSKVLVRYNPDDPDTEMNKRQLGRLKRLADWLHEHDRKFLFELLVPATDAQLEQAGGDSDRYDAELRPELMRRAIADIQDAGIEVDIWKIEGVDERSDCEMLVAQARVGGRDGVVCVVLGRGADDAKVDQWLTAAAPVEGFVGFAIGRSIWWDPLKAYVDGKIERSAGARKIAENFLRFVSVYERAAKATAPS
jgi:myo-inositol catabolism protein IolC